MSKRAVIITILGVLLVAFLVFINFGKNLPLLGFFEPEFTEEIPEKRPPRLDRRDLVRFEGMAMEEILSTLVAEREASEKPQEEARPKTSPLLASLPDRPIPFPEDAVPRDEKWLRDFVTSFETGEGAAPGKEDLWEFTLALSALRISPEQLPESLRNAGSPDSESDTLRIAFAPTPTELGGPFAIGDFNEGKGLEIIDQGGTRMSALDGEGVPVRVASSLSPYPGSHLAPADFDRDGDLDLLLLRRGGLPDSLLRNEGGGEFRDVTIELGLLAFRDSTAAAWIDYDGDGLLDLLSGSADHPLELYHQTEGGTFQPVAWDLKLWVPRGIRNIEVGDFSGDGLSDFFLGIDGYKDRFCRNSPAESWSDWRFPDVTADANLSPNEDGDVTFFDFDADGRLDILSLRPVGPVSGNPVPRFFHAREDGSFEEVGDLVEISQIQNIRSVIPIDIDNDGFLDLFCATPELEMNRLLWNRGGLTFKEISIASGASYLDAPLHAEVIDFDRNGVADLIYRNQSGAIRWLQPNGATQDWLRISIPRARAGMRIKTEVRDKDWVVHEISRQLQGEKSVLLGLGEADIVESISLFPAEGSDPLASREKVEPNQEITFELPPEPRRRAVAPL